MLSLYEFDLIDGYFPHGKHTAMIHTPENPVIATSRSKWNRLQGINVWNMAISCKKKKKKKAFEENELYETPLYFCIFFECVIEKDIKKKQLDLQFLYFINWIVSSNLMAFQTFSNSFMMDTYYVYFKEVKLTSKKNCLEGSR